MTVKNWTPAWRSFQLTGNPDDIVSAPTVAAALGQKIDATNGQASALQMDDQSTWGGKTIYDLMPDPTPTGISTLNGQNGAITGGINSVVALDNPLPDTAAEGTGILRADAYEHGASDYMRSCKMIRLSALSQTLRSWARHQQHTARLAAGATI